MKAGSLAVFSDWRGIRVRIWARASEEGPEVYLYGQVMTCFLQRPWGMKTADRITTSRILPTIVILSPMDDSLSVYLHHDSILTLYLLKSEKGCKDSSPQALFVIIRNKYVFFKTRGILTRIYGSSLSKRERRRRDSHRDDAARTYRLAVRT